MSDQQPSSEPYGERTTQYPEPPREPGFQGQYQGQYQGQPPYGGGMQQHHRPHLQVRSTFLTTEFWVLLLLTVFILVAAAVSDDEGVGGFTTQEAWKYITWLGVAYMLSRGLTKLGGNRRDGGEGGTRI